jgi:hypothetical protein
MDVFGRRQFLRLAMIYLKPLQLPLERATPWFRSWPVATETLLLKRSQHHFAKLLRLPHNRRRNPLANRFVGLQASRGERRSPDRIDKTVRSSGHRGRAPNIEARKGEGDPVRVTRYKMA